MGDQAPLCVRCGYSARGLESPTHACPECGHTAPGPIDDQVGIAETIAAVIRPRGAMLMACARSDRLLGSTIRNLTIACVLASIVIIWTWLIDPIRAVFGQPLLAATTLFHLVLVLTLGLVLLGAAALAFEHAAVSVCIRLMRMAQAPRVAARVTSISTLSLLVIAGLTLVIVAAARLSGLDDSIGDALPAGGLVAGALSWFRTTLAGLWTAGLLRDAAW